jgi:hypothetical protein
MGEDLETLAFGPSGGDSFRVDGDRDALAAEFLGRFAHELRPAHRLGVDRHLVGPGQQQLAHVFECPHPAADGQRHEALLGGARHDVKKRVAVFDAGRDVEEAELVGPFPVVETGRLDRVAGIDQVDEIDALDHPAVLDVEAGDDADFQHDRTGSMALFLPRRAPWR